MFKDAFIIFIYLISQAYLFEQSILFKMFLLICFVVGCLPRINNLYKLKYFKIKHFSLFILFTSLIAICLIRTNNNEFALDVFFRFFLFILSTLYLCLLTIDVCILRPINLFKVVRQLIIYPYAVFCSLNLFLYFTGISIKNIKIVEDLSGLNKATVLGLLGFRDIERVQFPLVTGFNSFGAVVGIMLTLSGVLYLVEKRRSLNNLISFFIFLITLLFIDTRASIFFPFLIFVLVFLLFKFKFKPLFATIKVIPYLYFIIPFIIFFVVPLFSYLGSSSLISRSNESLDTDFVRFVIWGFCVNDLSNFNFMHLIGFGEFGPLGSGVSRNWEEIFDQWVSGKFTTPHNSMLSLTYDGGYILLFIFLTLNRKLIAKITSMNKGKPELYMYVSFYLFCAVIGSTESVIGLYFADFLFYFIFITFLLLFTDVKRIADKRAPSLALDVLNK